MRYRLLGVARKGALDDPKDRRETGESTGREGPERKEVSSGGGIGWRRCFDQTAWRTESRAGQYSWKECIV